MVINIVLLVLWLFYHAILCSTFLSAVLDSQKMPTKSLLSSIYWCFNYPAGIQTLLCFSAATLSLKFMHLQTAPKVYFCSCVVHQSQICVKLYFLSQSVFLMWWIFPFCYCKQALAKQSSCQCKKIPYVRQLPVDFSSLLCANTFMFAQNFSLSMQTFSGQLRACLCSTGGLSSCSGALHCCHAAARALHSWFSLDQSTPLMWISSLSPHTAPDFLWQRSCREHKLHFILD